MHVEENIRKLNDNKRRLQNKIVSPGVVLPSNYNNIEKVERDFSIIVFNDLGKLSNITLNQIMYFDEMNGSKEICIKDKTSTEQIKLIQQLNEDDKKAIFRFISTMVVKNKFKGFFNKNIAALQC